MIIPGWPKSSNTVFNPVEFNGIIMPATPKNIPWPRAADHTEAKLSELATCKQYLQVQQNLECVLDGFLAFNERRGLYIAGAVHKKAADEFARREYEQFTVCRWEYKDAAKP